MAIIEIEDLTKYYGPVPGIRRVDLSVDKNEIFGFIGPNGAGKSTTIRILLNLIYPDSGSAKIFGLDSVRDSKEIKKNCGYVPGEINYYGKMTAEELFKSSYSFFGRKFDSKRYTYLTDALSLNVKKKIEILSLGNKKKVSLVQALLHRPGLLILDEPTSGLDPLVQSSLYELIREENYNGTTIFFSSHVLSEVQKLCSRVAIIKNGEVITVESIEKLRERSFKKVRVVLDAPAAEDFIPQGAVNPEVAENTIKFMYSGDINHLLDYLRKVKIKNLLIEDPTLEEIFIHYYEKKSPESGKESSSKGGKKNV
ncbi:MAG: ABC transporter ATP-binding protein [Bacteroidota bacterium]